MTDPDCQECDGEGYIEIQTKVDDTEKVCCVCNQLDDSDEAYDRWRDDSD